MHLFTGESKKLQMRKKADLVCPDLTLTVLRLKAKMGDCHLDFRRIGFAVRSIQASKGGFEMSHYDVYVLLVDGDESPESLTFDDGANSYWKHLEVANPESKFELRVNRILEPSADFHRVAPYRRECYCVWSRAIERAKDLPEWKIQGASFAFTREEFSKPGLELDWRRKVLELGSPDPSCEECGGSGIIYSRENPGQKCDYWEIGAGADGMLKNCIKGKPTDVNVVPVKDLDLQKLPIPAHIVTPDGMWFSENEFIWFFHAVVMDENWEKTVKRVLEEHKEATLAAVDVHL
jgi:hypothetical protein